jgi:hypothetical protein
MMPPRAIQMLLEVEWRLIAILSYGYSISSCGEIVPGF